MGNNRSKSNHHLSKIQPRPSSAMTMGMHSSIWGAAGFFFLIPKTNLQRKTQRTVCGEKNFSPAFMHFIVHSSELTVPYCFTEYLGRSWKCAIHRNVVWPTTPRAKSLSSTPPMIYEPHTAAMPRRFSSVWLRREVFANRGPKVLTLLTPPGGNGLRFVLRI